MRVFTDVLAKLSYYDLKFTMGYIISFYFIVQNHSLIFHNYLLGSSSYTRGPYSRFHVFICFVFLHLR